MERITNGVSQKRISFSKIEISKKYTSSVSQIFSFLGLGNNSKFPKYVKAMQEAKVTNQPDEANQLRSMWPAKEKPKEVQAFSSVFW